MRPKLVTLLGLHRGRTYEISAAKISIGRLPANHICLPEQGVSRQHCTLETEGERVLLRDLDSRNGTRVNGLPVMQRILEDGDVIEVGDSQFMFLRSEPQPEAPSPAVTIQDTSLETAIALKMPDRGRATANPGSLSDASASTGRKAHDLDVLLKINGALNEVRELESLERQLLEMLFQVIPAGRGAILLAGETRGVWESTFGLWRGAKGQRPVQVSRTVLRQVVDEGLGILSTDTHTDPVLRQSESLHQARVVAVLCVPLLAFDKLIGAIYLDTTDRARIFDRDHLALLIGIAGVAAPALENVSRLAHLESENRRLMNELHAQHNMVGESERFRQVQRFIAKAAPAEATVLIMGESGTGKELVARALHDLSHRAAKPFVAINCAAIPENLLEAELFGHERGAFTGAIALKRGKLEMAGGGTLFLDEIGELAPALQAKLLRVLQQREFERVGGTQAVRVDLRIIAATNRNLEDSVRAGSFRQDLFFRINVVAVTLPPLRDRREDIPLLATYFIAKLSEHSGRRVRSISPKAKACLLRYDWPGNVRELENAIERAMVLGSSEVIEVEDLPESLFESLPANSTEIPRFQEVLQHTKRQLILEAIEASQGTFTEAAKRLGLHPNYLHRLIRNLNLRDELRKRPL
ncbi:MAG: sigma 54-interacting transcriptional regulator [Terriglobia bacterium]